MTQCKTTSVSASTINPSANCAVSLILTSSIYVEVLDTGSSQRVVLPDGANFDTAQAILTQANRNAETNDMKCFILALTRGASLTYTFFIRNAFSTLSEQVNPHDVELATSTVSNLQMSMPPAKTVLLNHR